MLSLPRASLWPLPPGFSVHTASWGIPSIPAQSSAVHPLPGDPRHAPSFWRVGRCWVFAGDGQQEGVTDIKWATRAAECSHSYASAPDSQCPQSEGGGGRQGIAAMGRAHSRWRHPGGEEGTRAALPREGSPAPAPPHPSPPEPAPRPGTPGPAASFRGLQRREHRHLPVLGWQGVMEHELVAGRIISRSSTSVTLPLDLTDVLAGI